MAPPVAVSAKLMALAILLPRWTIAQPLKPSRNASNGRYSTTKTTCAEKHDMAGAPPLPFEDLSKADEAKSKLIPSAFEMAVHIEADHDSFDGYGSAITTHIRQRKHIQTYDI